LAGQLFPAARRIVPFAAGLIAISPVHIYYSQEARPYAQLICLATMTASSCIWVQQTWRTVARGSVRSHNIFDAMDQLFWPSRACCIGGVEPLGWFGPEGGTGGLFAGVHIICAVGNSPAAICRTKECARQQVFFRPLVQSCDRIEPLQQRNDEWSCSASSSVVNRRRRYVVLSPAASCGS
jgi:hypothetical protein